MKKKTIGKMKLQGCVDITDPCYSKDVWCRMNGVKVKPGEYTCVVWYQNEDNTAGDSACKIVGIIGIYLAGVIPTQKSMERIGNIGVDAGLAGFFHNKPDFSNEEWKSFCDKLWKNDTSAWLDSYGFYSASGYGDGEYDVYAFKANGEIVSLEIRFL